MHKILVVDDERPARNFIAELAAFYIPDSKVIQADSAYKALNLRFSILFKMLTVICGFRPSME